ncbi:MAG: hypothetical protein AAGA17_04655 [Actinomycetota bacterium]
MILLPWGETLRRLPRVVFGLVVFGVGIALMVVADLGLAPWDVLHQGISERTGLGIGTVIIVVGALVVLGFIPLRERVGLGTVLNAIVIGVSANAALTVLDEPEGLPVRVAAMIGGPVVIAFGSGLYIGAGLGPGPRDGIMTGLARRGIAVWKARTVIEVVVLVSGVALGGTVGIGTIWFAVGIGPMIGWWLPRLTLPSHEPVTAP